MEALLASVMFFTRLPLWRLVTVPHDAYERVVPRWPFVGWITAGIGVSLLLLAALVLPKEVALLVAIASRLVVTGCLHEDGLADFFDGFGGGVGRERILSIMKDSHIGSYGVIGLILYFALYYTLLNSLPLPLIAAAMMAGDPFSKGVAAQIINRLPYARKEAEAKNKTVYSRMTKCEFLFCLMLSVPALAWLPAWSYLWAALFPIVIWYLLTSFMKRCIQGYTGDCCGATFLLCELSFYFGFVIVYHLNG